MFAQVILIGRLGRDPEHVETASTELAKFSLATDYSYKNKTGEWTKKTEWSDVKVWGKAAGSVTQNLAKGALVAVIGRPETESWEDKKSGEKKYRTVVIADRVIFLESREKGTKPENSRNTPTTTIADDDIPF
jgi:single-strand DNA-binding protein